MRLLTFWLSLFVIFLLISPSQHCIADSSPASVTATGAVTAPVPTKAPVKVNPKTATGIISELSKVFQALKTKDIFAVLVALCNLIIALLKSPTFQKMVNGVLSKLLNLEWRPSKRQKIVGAFGVASALSYFFFPKASAWGVMWNGFKIALMAMGLRSLYKHFVEVPLNGKPKSRGELLCPKCGFINPPVAESCEKCQEPLTEGKPKDLQPNC